jgi:hypothetical protein
VVENSLEFVYEGKTYKTQYFPFFRIKKLNGYQIFGIRYPSGNIERVFVMNEKDTLSELRDYLKFLVREYLLEENDSLTPHAQRLKEDIRELFRK